MRRQIYCVCVCFSWEDSQESCAGGMRKSPCDILPFCSLLPVAFRGLRHAFMVLPEECQWFSSPDGCPPSASWVGATLRTLVVRMQAACSFDEAICDEVVPRRWTASHHAVHFNRQGFRNAPVPSGSLALCLFSSKFANSVKSGCVSREFKAAAATDRLTTAGVNLPGYSRTGIRKSKTGRWRAAALILLNLFIIAHIIQWRLMGRTISPIEPSETMYTLQNGFVNAGFIFLAWQFWRRSSSDVLFVAGAVTYLHCRISADGCSREWVFIRSRFGRGSWCMSRSAPHCTCLSGP